MVGTRVILSERSERKDRFRATAVKALDGQRSFRRFATQDDRDVASRLRMTATSLRHSGRPPELAFLDSDSNRRIRSSQPLHFTFSPRVDLEPSVSEVILNADDNFERALRRFKKNCEKAGILSDLRKHRHYEKPSERRKRKMNAAVRKNRMRHA